MVKLVTEIRLEHNISKTAGDNDSFPIKGPPIGNDMEYQMVMWPMTSRDPEMCCEAVRSAILATALLLVFSLLPIVSKFTTEQKFQ